MRIVLNEMSIVRGRKILVMCAVLVSMSTSLSVANDDELPSAEAILDGHVEATGGKAAYLEATSRKMTGSISMNIGGHKLDGFVTVHAKAPDMYHLEIESNDGFQMTRGTDGEHAWEISEMQGARMLDGGLKSQLMEQAQFHGTVNWRDQFKEAKTVGVVEIDGAPAYEIHVTPNDGDTFSQFYDKESGRLVKFSRTVTAMSDVKVKIDVTLSEYREYNGLAVPTRIEQLIHDLPGAGSGTQTWAYTDVEHNLPIDDSIFAVPDEIEID